MIKTIGITDSETIQKFYVCSNSLQSLQAHRNQLLIKRSKIEEEESLSHKQKERQLVLVNCELDNLRREIRNMKLQDEMKDQKKELDEKMDCFDKTAEDVPRDFSEVNKTDQDKQMQEDLEKYNKGNFFDLYS